MIMTFIWPGCFFSPFSMGRFSMLEILVVLSLGWVVVVVVGAGEVSGRHWPCTEGEK